MRKNVKKKPAAKNASSSGATGRPLYWIGLVCISSIWMFILGVLVGRGTAPISFDIKKLQKELAGITHTIQEKEERDLKEYADRIDSKTELDFYENLKESEKSAIKPGVGTKPALSNPETQNKKSLSKATKRHMLYKIRQSEPETASKKESLETPTYGWTIQVSSLKSTEAADKMVSDLKKLGHPAYKVITNSDNGIFYRVRVGPYKDRKQADQKLSVLKQNDYDAILISM